MKCKFCGVRIETPLNVCRMCRDGEVRRAWLEEERRHQRLNQALDIAGATVIAGIIILMIVISCM